MKYTETKTYTERINGRNYKRVITVTFRMSDPYNNGHKDFAITADVVDAWGRFVCGGCCRDLIAKKFPHLRPFLPLHLCNELGQPSFVVDNFIFHLTVEKWSDQKAAEYYRVTPEQLAELRPAVGNKDFFRYRLITSGAVDNWKAEADRAIKWLEEKTGQTFAPTAAPSGAVIATPEFMAEMAGRIDAGEFTPEAEQKRKQATRDEWAEKERAEIMAAHTFAERCRDLALWLVDNSPTTNYIFLFM